MGWENAYFFQFDNGSISGVLGREKVPGSPFFKSPTFYL